MSEMPKEPMGEELPENEAQESDAPDVTEQEITGQYIEAEARLESPVQKKPKRVSLFAFVLTTVSLVVAAVMITHTVSTAIYRQRLADVQIGESGNTSVLDEYGYPFWRFSQLIDHYSLSETDKDAMMAAALKAYVAATGDRYAYYYTADEYAELQKSNAGESEGIGINIINTEATINGNRYLVIKIINVMDGSPAEAAGLKVGDLIYGVGEGESLQTVTELGFDRALVALKGEAGTEAVFTVLRPDGDGYVQPPAFRIKRDKVTSESVYYRIHATEPDVGIVKILQFDLTTPQNFSKAMDALITAGCTKFVFDVRYNPGGDLASIQAVLSYFLNEGDVVIRTEYKNGTERINKVGAVAYEAGSAYASCNVSADDIGKYRRDGFEFAVICNGGTASAAELFTATFRDYGLGRIIGTTTFGKGSMQSIMPLWSYGCEGALKLTVAKYFSGANGGYNDGYDGIGIVPDDVCELSEEAASKNIYDLSDDEDDQLKKAVENLKK